MNDLKKYLDIINDEKIKRGYENLVPLYPMLRNQNGKLYIAIMLVNENDKVWSIDGNVKPEYWALIDINTENVIEFNKIDDKNYINGKNYNKQMEISKYTVAKSIQYKEYLIEDIKNGQLPIEKKLISLLGNEVKLDEEIVNVNDYVFSLIEGEVKTKIDELVKTLVTSKYSYITFYYDLIYNQVLYSYINKNIIDSDKIKLCIEIMDYYYDGVLGIDNLFNI